ncbi:hypothetical protein J6590_093717 [Homalodisca vitripennis]|nr:hypothetical protein J6590_093717 [Homalodisca vitripennis]
MGFLASLETRGVAQRDTAERSCPCKQPACPTVSGGSDLTFKQWRSKGRERRGQAAPAVTFFGVTPTRSLNFKNNVQKNNKINR